jgi:hypothetical protein
MQLNLVTGNVVSKALNKNTKNILYEPKYNLLDNIVFNTNYKFYIFGNNSFDYQTPNVLNLPERLYGVYNYSMHVSYNIEKYIENNHITKNFHVPGIIIIDPNIKSYKKEDKYILCQKIKNYHKIFLSNESFEYLGKPTKSYVIPIGIPTNIFSSVIDNKNRSKDVIIINDNVVAQQLKQTLENINLTCDIIDIKFKNSEALNNIFNRYKYCIDTTDDNYINLLCAISSGCRGISTAPSAIPCPLIVYANDINDIVKAITDESNKPDHSLILEYLKTNFPYEEFYRKINSIFSTVDKEVFIQ